MHRYFAVCFLLLLGFTGLHAQKTQNLVIPLPIVKVKGSLYNAFKVIDSRADTTNLGIVQLGAFNRKAKVVPKIPVTVQLAGVFNALTDETAAKGEMILLLRQYTYAEVEGGFTEKGYCYLRAASYAGNNGQYRQVGRIDTVICLKSSLDVTQMILDSGAAVITHFIQENLVKQPAAGTENYSYADLSRIDSVEKRKIKLYNTQTYTDGLYMTYASFKDMQPDKQFTLEGNDVNYGTIKTVEIAGKPQKVKSENVYAIVFKGRPYIATKYGYYELSKKGDDLFFTGQAKTAPGTGEVVAATMLFGILGDLMASSASSTFEMKIDHINGGFIRLKEIVPPASTYQEQ